MFILYLFKQQPIVAVAPQLALTFVSQVGERSVLTCSSEGHPSPKMEWEQLVGGGARREERWCTALYSNVLYCTVMYCIVIYCTVL